MADQAIYMTVLDVLQRASSQNPEILKPAEAKLKEWETQPGFYLTLMNVLSNEALEMNVRWIAVLYLKIGIDRYWRIKAPNAIDEEEKTRIKQALLSSFSEPIYQIAVQKGVLISKIARMDCPNNWPELFPTLVQGVESCDDVVQHRALLTMHHVIKSIASKRLAVDVGNFQQFTSNIYSYIFNLWKQYTDDFINDVLNFSNSETLGYKLEKALLTVRIMKKLTIFGIKQIHAHEDCGTFLTILYPKAKIMLECRKILVERQHPCVEQCEKFIILLTKILLSILELHPFSFIELIEETLKFTFYYLFTDEGVTFLFERFVIQCFNLIKDILLCKDFQATKAGERNIHTRKANENLQNFFQPLITADMLRKIVLHYFQLTQEELEIWDNDPETFINDDRNFSWKYCLRTKSAFYQFQNKQTQSELFLQPSIEVVFITLFHEYRDQLRPIVLEMLNDTKDLVAPEDLAGILKKDAVYNAVGLCSFDLYDELDFNQWLTSTLLQELKIKCNTYRILRRRVLSLIGRWVEIKLSTELRPTVYEAVNSMMGPDEDLVVRLTAAITLRWLVDNFDFDSEQFKDYLFSCFNLLYNLLTEVKECETKMHVLGVMTLLVERMGPTIIPHSDGLIRYLPHLWQESEEHNMLRCAIVSTLVQVVKGMGFVKDELAQFLMPIIQLGTNTKQEAIVYLLEDALDLWIAVLEHSTVMTKEILQLFNNMPSLLEYSTEYLRPSLLICIMHFMLNPELAIRAHGAEIIAVLTNLISDLRNEGQLMLARLIETIIKVSPQLGTEVVVPILPAIFEKAYEGQDYPMVMTMCLCILSRVLLSSHDVFTRVLSVVAQSHNENSQQTLSNLLTMWLKKMCNASQSEQRKLLGLALSNLLTTQSAPVLERFPKIMDNILEVLNDISKSDEGGVMTDSLVLTEGQSPSTHDEEDTDHNCRKKQLAMMDPVHTIVLKDYLQSQIFELRNLMGLQHYEQLVQSIDAECSQQLREYITF